MMAHCKNCDKDALQCDCIDNKNLELALSAFNLAVLHLSMLGYELPEKFEFKKRKEK